MPFNTFWEGVEEDVEDIEAVSFRGLGRGMGFEKTESFSILHDEKVTSRIASKCHDILELLGEYEWLDSLLDRINGVLGEEYDDLEEAVDILISVYIETMD